MGQPNFIAFNKWKKVWVAGFLEKKHRSIVRGQNQYIQVRAGHLHREMAVEDFIATFETSLPLVILDNADCIHRQCVEVYLMNFASAIREERKKGRLGNK
jgi:hypothetical protein